MGVLAFGIASMQPMLAPVMSEGAMNLIQQLLDQPMRAPEALLVERHRLIREWSAFFVDHPVVIGPTWTDVQFEHDGLRSRRRHGRDGRPAPVHHARQPARYSPVRGSDWVHGGLPVGVQVYTDLWRGRPVSRRRSDHRGRIRRHHSDRSSARLTPSTSSRSAAYLNRWRSPTKWSTTWMTALAANRSISIRLFEQSCDCVAERVEVAWIVEQHARSGCDLVDDPADR